MASPRRRPFALAAALLAAGTAARAGEPVDDACRAGWPGASGCERLVRELERDPGPGAAWVGAGPDAAQARAVAEALRGAWRHGLRPDDYRGGWSAAEAPPAEAGRARGLALEVALLRFLSDLRVGRVSPREARWHLEVADAGPEVVALAHRVASGEDVTAVVASAEPPFAAYRRTRHALEQYVRLAAEPDGPPVPAPARKIEPGQRWDGVAALEALLRRTGDLPPGEPPAEDGRYAGALVAAVERFQRRHGLEPDGVIGAATARQLAVPLSRRVTQLELTLERWRWLPRRFTAPPVVVNVPEFRLHAFDPASGERLAMKVVVGTAFRGPTPLFAASMRSVTFRPAWTVPLRIQREELVPAIARDPQYLSRHGYEVLDRSGAVVAAERVSPEQLRALRTGTLQLRQRPGPRNSLGTVRFSFPNPHDVFLHGTPARALFARSRRDFSHGCIRVEDPLALAVWVLRDRPDWPPERIRAAMEGEETIQVALSHPIPVFVVYGTALVDEDGAVRFLDDVYGLDAALEAALLEHASRAG
jgi:L,D-transpeptidase YcbB